MLCHFHVKLLLLNLNHITLFWKFQSIDIFSGGNLGLNPATSPGYFCPGGRHNARRKSDCGDRSTMGRGDSALPDITAFQQVRTNANGFSLTYQNENGGITFSATKGSPQPLTWPHPRTWLVLNTSAPSQGTGGPGTLSTHAPIERLVMKYTHYGL